MSPKPTHAFLVAVVALATCGCRVIVFGDSNSCFGFTSCPPGLWPSMLQDRLDAARSGWLVETHGMLGMTAGRFVDTGGNELRSRASGAPLAAAGHLDDLLRQEDLGATCRRLPFDALAPRLVIAVGTNDIMLDGAANVVDHIFALARQALDAAPCLRVYYVTIPPRFAGIDRPQDAQRMMANALLRSRVPADRLIEFDQGFTREDFRDDGVHANERGHAKLADSALRVLFPALD